MGTSIIVLSSHSRISNAGTVALSLSKYIREQYDAVFQQSEYVCCVRYSGYTEPESNESGAVPLPVLKGHQVSLGKSSDEQSGAVLAKGEELRGLLGETQGE